MASASTRSDRRYLASPQALYWSALVNRVYDGGEGFAGLSPAERSYYAVSVLSGEVHNGGFDQVLRQLLR